MAQDLKELRKRAACCTPFLEPERTIEVLLSAVKDAAQSQIKVHTDGCLHTNQHGVGSCQREAAHLGHRLGKALQDALLELLTNQTQAQQQEVKGDDEELAAGRAPASARILLPAAYTQSQHQELVQGIQWNIQAAGLLCDCARKTHAQCSTPVYVACNLEAYGPTRATQAGLFKVSWPGFGLKAEAALSGEHQGTGTLLYQYLPGKHQPAYHIGAIAVHFSGVPQASATDVSVCHSDEAASRNNDNAVKSTQHQAPASRRRRPAPKHVQPPFKVAAQLVSTAVSALLQQLKESSGGGFGTTSLENKLQSLLPSVGRALLSMIRSAHSPVLLPFSCSTLQCTAEQLEASLYATLQGACTRSLAIKLARRQVQVTAATGAYDTSPADDAEGDQLDDDDSVAADTTTAEDGVSHKAQNTMADDIVQGDRLAATQTGPGTSAEDGHAAGRTAVNADRCSWMAPELHPDIGPPQRQRIAAGHTGLQATADPVPAARCLEPGTLTTEQTTDTTSQAWDAAAGYDMCRQGDDSSTGNSSVYPLQASAVAQAPVAPILKSAMQLPTGKTQADAGRGRNLHDALQQLYGIKPVKKQCLAADSSQWLF